MRDDGDGVPQEMECGETTRLESGQLYDLIEKSEGVAVAERVLASGTPNDGLPQLELESERPEPPEPPVVAQAVLPPAPSSTRFLDFMIGGAISAAAMIAWYCATQL